MLTDSFLILAGFVGIIVTAMFAMFDLRKVSEKVVAHPRRVLLSLAALLALGFACFGSDDGPPPSRGTKTARNLNWLPPAVVAVVVAQAKVPS